MTFHESFEAATYDEELHPLLTYEPVDKLYKHANKLNEQDPINPYDSDDLIEDPARKKALPKTVRFAEPEADPKLLAAWTEKVEDFRDFCWFNLNVIYYGVSSVLVCKF